MIRLNRQTDYAIRVILALAKRPPGTRLSTTQIRDEMLIPPALSVRIVAELARGELIITFPGREGGIQLARPAAEINLLHIVEQFEGPIYLSDCFLEDRACKFETQCPVRRRWSSLQEIIRNELKKITFKDLAADAMALDYTPEIKILVQEEKD